MKRARRLVSSDSALISLIWFCSRSRHDRAVQCSKPLRLLMVLFVACIVLRLLRSDWYIGPSDLLIATRIANSRCESGKVTAVLGDHLPLLPLQATPASS